MSGEAPQLALDLDLKGTHGLGDLIRNWQRCDPHMVRQVAFAHPAGANILAHATEPFRVQPIDSQAMRHLVVLLREMYDHLVLDLGPSVEGGTLEAARLAEVVVIMVRPEVPALRLARAYIRYLYELGIPRDRIRAVGNRTGFSKQVAQAEAEKVLGVPVAEWVPDDTNTVTGALGVGQPLVQYYSWATITQTFNRLARALAGVKA
jgi:pilus assembly protein CpaE